MAKKNKVFRPKARVPRGFADRDAAEIRSTEAMMAKIREVFERYGFDPVETPMFEYTDALGKFLPDQDRPNEGVFSLQDEDDQWMSLRYDLTAPLARHVAENFNKIHMPYRTYRSGWVFRNEKPGPGRFRQFMQFDADSVGAPGPSADAEMCMMMADTMEALGIKRGKYVVRVNNRKVLDGVMEAIGLGGDENAGKRLTVLRALDKFDKFGVDGVELLLGEGRKDESGDFTKGAKLTSAAIDELVAIFLAPELDDKIESLAGVPAEQAALLDDILSSGGEVQFDEKISIALVTLAQSRFNTNISYRNGLTELLTIAKLVWNSGYQTDRIRVDPSVVRGLEYYTGPVYECELTFPVTNEKGEEVVFGSVAGGGRYDGLVKRFTGQDVPATGFSIGVSRLMTALKNLGKLDTNVLPGPVLVTVMDRDAESLARYQKMTQELRAEGIRAEMYQGNPRQFGKQLQYADRRGSPCVVIAGEDEFSNGQVTIKDLVEGARMSEHISDNEEWRSGRPAQMTVARDQLVATVKEIILSQQTR